MYPRQKISIAAMNEKIHRGKKVIAKNAKGALSIYFLKEK
jgi:hypothetical protein